MVISGRLQIPFDDLFLYSKKEIDCLVEGYNLNHKDILLGLRRHAYIVSSPYFPKDKDVTLQSLWRFDWEPEEEVKFASKDDFEEAKKILDIVHKARLKNGKSANRS